MFRLVSAILVLALLQKGQVHASTLTGSEDVYATCRANYDEQFDNDFLIGEWFQVMHFQLFGGLMPSPYCINHVYSRATAADVTPFEQKHGVTIPMEDSPMLLARDTGQLTNNLIAGNVQAKLYFLDHTWHTVSSTVYNYKKLNDDFVLWWDCALRGNDIWLLSRTPQPTDAEIEAAIAGADEVSRRDRTRHCAY